jgi:phosphonate transport system substrate-binding protein
MGEKTQKGKNMKKRLFATLILGGLMSAAALTGCNNTESNTIHLQLVPSNDPATLLTRATALAPILKKYVPEYEWTVDVGTDYSATTTALVNGQIDGGFLTASGYAETTIQHAGKVDLLLSASRAGYKVQADDFPGFDDAAKAKQLAAMNGEITNDGTAVTSANADKAYVYRGDQSTTQVNFYSGIIFCLKDEYRVALGKSKLDANNDGKVTIKEIHDANATVGHMGAESGSGTIYPTKYIYDQGYTLGFKDKADYEALSTDQQALAIRGVNQTDYPTSVASVMDGTLDAACGFMDTRYGSAFVQAGGKYENDESVFTHTYTVAITDPIMNDTVSAYSGLSDAKKAAIKKALKAAVKDCGSDGVTGKNAEKGTGSWLLYQIYSHTGYVDAKDSDYDSAREMYRWTAAHTK